MSVNTAVRDPNKKVFAQNQVLLKYWTKQILRLCKSTKVAMAVGGCSFVQQRMWAIK